MKPRFRYAALVCLCLLWSGGCSGVLDPGPALRHLLLSPELPARTHSDPAPFQLAVAMPDAGNDINTDRIAALFAGYEVRYLGTAKWAEPVPRMLQRLLVESLEVSGVAAGVSADDSGFVPQIRLACDVKRFYLRYPDNGGAEVEVAALMRLLDLRSGKVLGHKLLQTRGKAADHSRQEMVRAFDSAVGVLLSQNSLWTGEVLRDLAGR